MKQKDLITYGLIALGIYLITKPKEPKTSEVSSDEIYQGDKALSMPMDQEKPESSPNIANN